MTLSSCLDLQDKPRRLASNSNFLRLTQRSLPFRRSFISYLFPHYSAGIIKFEPSFDATRMFFWNSWYVRPPIKPGFQFYLLRSWIPACCRTSHREDHKDFWKIMIGSLVLSWILFTVQASLRLRNGNNLPNSLLLNGWLCIGTMRESSRHLFRITFRALEL